MPNQPKTAIERGRSVAAVGLVALLLVTASAVLGLSGAAAAESERTSDAAPVDVVFVVDSSQSANEDRYHLAREIDALPDRLGAVGVDARYALITYNDTVRTELRPTADFASFERAMHFPEGGNVERASPAISTATEMSFRDDAKTVVVVVTDEDDDSTAEARNETLDDLSGVTEFVAVSPATAQESSCDVHSPPCDDRSDNELRTMAESVGGTWIDADDDAEVIVEDVGDAVVETAETTGDDGTDSDVSTDDESSSENASPASDWRDSDDPEFETVNRSANRTTAETGDRVAFNETVENVGSAGGTYRAYLSHRGTVLAEETVLIPKGETRTVTFVRQFEETGTYEIHLSYDPAATVEVVEPREASVETTATDGGELRANVSDARANGTVSISLADADLTRSDAVALEAATMALGDVDATPSHDVAFETRLDAGDAPPSGVEPLPESVSEVTYLTVDSSLGENLTGVGFEYAAGSPDATLYRYDSEAAAWTPVEQSRVEDGRWRTATTDGTTFAVGVRRPAFTISDVELADRSVEAGEPVTVTAMVANEGTATGSYDATATVDGTPVAVERVRLEADETRRVNLTFVPDESGAYAVAVGESSPRSLRVAEATPDGSGNALTAENAGGQLARVGGPGFGGVSPLVMAVLVGAAALGFVFFRRR